MTNPTTPPESTPREHSFSPLAGFLSYLVPGLGQIAQGRIGKGLLFFVCLYGMFFAGMAMGSWKNVYIVNNANDENAREDGEPENRAPWANNPWHIRNRTVANLINRMPYIGQLWIGAAAWPAIWQYNKLPVPSGEFSPFLHDFQSQPKDDEVSQLLAESDKTPDIALVYTIIAGVLNILVIYDAFAGPAYVRRRVEEHDEPAPAAGPPIPAPPVPPNPPPEAVSL